jgi:hypothetical protein
MSAVWDDFEGSGKSVFRFHGGLVALKENKAWYRNVNESKKRYVRRMTNVIRKFKEWKQDLSISDCCAEANKLASGDSGDKVSLKKLEALFGLTKSPNT